MRVQGICEGLTYEDFEARYPKQFGERDKDKVISSSILLLLFLFTKYFANKKTR